MKAFQIMLVIIIVNVDLKLTLISFSAPGAHAACVERELRSSGPRRAEGHGPPGGRRNLTRLLSRNTFDTFLTQLQQQYYIIPDIFLSKTNE